MKTTLEKKIDKKYSDIQKIYQSSDENLNLLIHLLAEELVIIDDCRESINEHGSVIITGKMFRMNPSITIRATSINSATRIIRQIHQMNSNDDTVTASLEDFLD